MQINYCYGDRTEKTITVNCDRELINSLIEMLEEKAYNYIADTEYDKCKNVLDARQKLIEELDAIDSDIE